MNIIHPTNDESLASYHRPELVAQLPSLELALDCWSLLNTNGQGSEKAKYLPKEVAEPAPAYRARLGRSTYAPIFRDSIRAYAGLLSRFYLVDAPPTMAAAEQNVDLQGSSVHSFWSHCDELAIRDGGVFVMVDMPPASGETNYLDEQRDGRSPYLIMVERKDVVNWSVEYIRGREFVRHATVRQIRSRPSPDGYGCIVEPVYLVLKPGSVETIRLEKRDNRWMQVSEGVIPTTMPVVPMVWYGATSSKFAQGDLPLNGVAELTIAHYQMRSDLQELLHRCAMPVPVRKGGPVGTDGRPAPLVLGPNTAVDLPETGSFDFAEPTGRSLERHQAEINHLEELIDRSGLAFLRGTTVKTATEAALRASQVSSQVSSLVRNKTSAFTTIMRLWAMYSGETGSLTPESGIAMNTSLINRPLEASEIAQLTNLYKNGLLSKRSVLEELQRGSVLDPDLRVEAELERIEVEQATEPPPPVVGPVTEDPMGNFGG